VTIDKSASKTGEDILKATALFGIFSFMFGRANLHYECSEDVKLFALAATYAVGVAFLLLGFRIIIDRFKGLYPWIFVGRNWLGIIIYATVGGLYFSLAGPVGSIITNNPSMVEDSAAVCN